MGSLEGLSRVQIPSSPLKMTEEAAVAILLVLFIRFLTNIKRIKIERTRIREVTNEKIIESFKFKFELTFKE